MNRLRQWWRRWKILAHGRFGWVALGIEYRTLMYRQIVLVYDPIQWRFGQDHGWYDGPHCSYRFGPFEFTESWSDCKKCLQ